MDVGWLERSETLLSRLPIRKINSNAMVPFQWNFNQAKRYRMIKEQWRTTGKIRVLDLKSRRVGVSAQTDGIFWCAGMAFPNMNIKIVAHLQGSSEELFRVPSDLSRAFPGFATEDIQMKRIFFPHEEGQSTITLATAGTPAAGRGGTLTMCHLCLRGDSLIAGVDGELRRIDGLREGDFVRTHRGTVSKISLITSKSDDRKIVTIKTWMNCETLTVTEDHKVWTTLGWVPARELTKEHWIGTPIRSFSGKLQGVDLPSYRDVWGRKKRGKCDGGLVSLDKEFGFFCGYYIAEGYLGNNPNGAHSVSFSHHQDEAAFAERAANAVLRWSTSHKTKKQEGKRACTSVYGTSLARWIEKEFGRADGKKIPDWLFDAPRAFAEGFVLGYLCGDGSKTLAKTQGYECPSIYATSTRPGILYQFRHLLAALGIGWGGITKRPGFVDSRGWNNKAAWTISINGHAAIKLRELLGMVGVNNSKQRAAGQKYRMLDGWIWTRVKSISPDSADSVWDIEVDHPDHSFETVIGAVANSEAAYYPSDDSFTSMISSVSKGPGSAIVIESTANGREGPGEAFFEYWTNAVAGRNGYIPMFLCWLEDPACIRPEEEAEDAPADDLEKELMNPPFNATRAQIAWMRQTKAEDCRDVEAKWLQDFPHCPQVAFQVSGSPAFAREEIAYGYGTVKPPLCQGDFIRAPNGGFRFEKRNDGRTLIWKFPFDKNGKSDGHKYYIGADSAAGVEDRDFAAGVVLCGQTGELAARIAETMDPEEFADQLDMMGRWYNLALINPELTGGLGRWTLVKLRDVFRYPQIAKWKGRFDRKRGKDISNALGFEMNNSTRRLIIDAARSGMRMAMKGEPGGLVINDEALQTQISLCTIKEWRWEVARGHDDILVAWAIACLTREEFPPPRMTFAPKSTMEPETPAQKLEALGIGSVKLESELPGMFQSEMRRIIRQAGLNSAMRGTGRVKRDRLIGI